MRPLGPALRRSRMRRILKRHPIPHHVWQRVSRRVLVLRGLDAVQMAHLRELTTWFLNQKSITGARKLEVTPSMRVTVAAQACLLIVNLGVEHFDGWNEVRNVVLHEFAHKLDGWNGVTNGMPPLRSDIISFPLSW